MNSLINANKSIQTTNMNPFFKYLKEEDRLQKEVVDYVQLQYNVDVIPLNTESKKTPFEQFKFKYMGGQKGVVDLFIPVRKESYAGLFIELKTKYRKVFKKDGTLYASGKETHQAQIDFIHKMKERGYCAHMTFGFEETKIIIDTYMKLK